MKFEHTQVMNFEGALRGMRNPMNSWDKSDSRWEDLESYISRLPDDNIHYQRKYIIGEKDMQLAQKLIRAGSEHRKFMRQIFVCVDITAPLYWFKEFDTYKVGTVANSTSTMHKLASTPITLDCFDTDDVYDFDVTVRNTGENDTFLKKCILPTIDILETIRQKYLETKDKRYWKELIRFLPESWLQTRTVTLNYENLLAMCSKGQRRFHKLNEWSGQDNPSLPNFISWARSLPYAQELIFIDEIDKPKKES